MKKYKAIISDIDGTLTPIVLNSYPSEKVTQAIKKATKLGIKFSLASGRPFFLLEYLVKHLELTAPSITDNGAVIVDSNNGSVLWEALLSHSETMEILKFTKGQKLTRASTDNGSIDNPTEIPQNAKIRKVSVHGLKPEIANQLIKKVELKLKNLAIARAAAYEGKEFMDVYFSNAQATKQHAVLKYAELLGISTDEIIGIGDGENDFPLLMACGLKVAMGNAVESIKSIADYIAPTVEEDGIVDVIEKYILNQ